MAKATKAPNKKKTGKKKTTKKKAPATKTSTEPTVTVIVNDAPSGATSTTKRIKGAPHPSKVRCEYESEGYRIFVIKPEFYEEVGKKKVILPKT